MLEKSMILLACDTNGCMHKWFVHLLKDWKICSLDYCFGVRAENLILLSEQTVFWKIFSILKTSHVCQSILNSWFGKSIRSFKFKMYQSKRNENPAMYQCRENNFTKYQRKILQSIRVIKTVFQCIRVKLSNVSE